LNVKTLAVAVGYHPRTNLHLLMALSVSSFGSFALLAISFEEAALSCCTRGGGFYACISTFLPFTVVAKQGHFLTRQGATSKTLASFVSVNQILTKTVGRQK